MQKPQYTLFMFLLFGNIVIGQELYSAQRDSHDKVQGAEQTGFYIGASSGFATGFALGSIVSGITESNERTVLPLMTGIWTALPGSLIGMGIASLFSNNHSDFLEGFRVSTGAAFTKIGDPLVGNKVRSGIFLRLESPHMNRWRYHIGTTAYLPVQYYYLEEPADRSWWDFYLGIRYTIPIAAKVSLYPFLESSLFYEKDQLTDGFGGNYTSDHFAVESGIGFGIEFDLSNHWYIFGETQFRINEDRDLLVPRVGIGYSFNP